MHKLTRVRALGALFDKGKCADVFAKNLPLLLRCRAKECPDVTLQAVRNEVGKFDTYSYELVYRKVLDLACVLQCMGVRRGDMVGLIADNRREWLITDMALLSLGAADVPRGCDSMGTEIRFILGYTGCRIAFFENVRQLEKILEKPEDVPELKTAVLFDSADTAVKEKAAGYGIRVRNFVDIEDESRKSTDSQRAKVELEMMHTSPEETATIIFTSGTTGTPKGVILTHDNFLAQCEVVHQVLPDASEGDLWLSVLPVWHSFERAFTYFYIALKSGCIYSKPAAGVMLSDMAALHPRWMCGVPRLWESLARRFYSEMRRKGRLPYALFTLSVSIGKSFWWAKDRVCGLICRYRNTIRVFDTMNGIVPFLLLYLPYRLCDLLVYRQIRARLGGKMTGAISGGGSLQAETDAFYHAIGFRLLEGYGLTEAAPVLSMRNSRHPRSGCVGEIFPSSEVKIVAEQDGKPVSDAALRPGRRGLVLARGRQIMKGYYKRPDLTAQVIDHGGWLNTGDIGMLTQDHELKITGRAKDTIVLLGGENIEPQVIENAICGSQYIETAVVVGQDRKYIGALVVPVKDAVIAYADENRVMYENYEALLDSNEIQNLIREEIDRRVCAGTGFRTCERIFRFHLLPESFKPGVEINAKQEKMRHRIGSIHANEIKRIFE